MFIPLKLHIKIDQKVSWISCIQPITRKIKKLRSTIPKITGKIKSQDDIVKLFIFAPKIIELSRTV